MPDMPKGLLPRFIAYSVGIVLVSAFINFAGFSPDGGGLVELLYLFGGAIYFTYFLLKHEDEIPTRSGRD